MTNLKQHEVEALRNAPGMIADGGETHPELWDLENRGYLRPIYSYNPVHYKDPESTVHVYPFVGYNFTEPVYVYTRTEFGEATNAMHEELEQQKLRN